jgi:prepilin-type N-terminal cleavage/methylation domain-containing protein
MSKGQRGFTLVEIAIVLVIIGLLLGGILKGQEMITQAKIKNVIADMTGISAAMYGYQDRYRALPGDDKNAPTRWTIGGTPNGDGIINSPYLSTTATDESVMFWDHLRRAGFVSGTGTDQPFNAVSGKMGVQTGNGPAQGTAPAGVLGTPPGPTVPIASLILCSANLPDKIAISVDSQTDDGLGVSGTVRGMLQTTGPNPVTIAGTASAYVEDGVSTYVVCRTL